MRVALDFDDPERAAHVPRHGWARNSQGLKLLWLPILRLVHETNRIREAQGLTQLSAGQWSEISAFEQTTHHLTVTLRELAKCLRLGSDSHLDDGDTDAFAASRQAGSLIPLYVDLAFVYLRRQADHFTRASRYALFKNFKSAPREYKRLRLVLADERKLRQLAPLCNEGVLRQAFQLHSNWLDRLRDSTDAHGVVHKGIRDIMEHHATAVSLSHSRSGEDPWDVAVSLGHPGVSASFRANLVPTLREVVADMAALWTMVCEAAELPVAQRLWVAPYGDAVLLFGDDNDSTSFWPESTPT